MAKYVDGFVLVVPMGKEAAYKKMAQDGAKSWMKHGALEYYECKGDDLARQEMGSEKARSFPEMAGVKEGETVWFSFIVFKSKKHRDQVNAKVMVEMDEQMKGHENDPMPFDMRRMAYGGFEAVVVG